MDITSLIPYKNFFPEIWTLNRFTHIQARVFNRNTHASMHFTYKNCAEVVW
jgi:hypothetical protein